MKKLVIYTSFSFMLDSFDLALREKFKDVHFHIITFRDHPERVLQHIKREAQVNAPSADIVIGPHWMVLDLQLHGLLRPYESPEFDAYPEGFYDPRGAWCGMALSPVGIAYNTSLVSPNAAPKTLDEAVDVRWCGKLAVHSITQNSEGRMGLAYLVSLARIAGRRKYERVVDGLAEVKPASYECMPEMALTVGKGEKYIGFPATLACISYYIDIQNRPVALSMPNDIPYLATFSPTIGLVAGCENTETAETAFDFALSKDWQERVGAFGGKIPARPGVYSYIKLPEDFTLFPALDDVANHQSYLNELKKKIG